MTGAPLNIRFSKHCYDCERYPERKICQSLNKYGPENHKVKSLELIKDKAKAKRREREFIMEKGTVKHGLNSYTGFDVPISVGVLKELYDHGTSEILECGSKQRILEHKRNEIEMEAK